MGSVILGFIAMAFLLGGLLTTDSKMLIASGLFTIAACM